MRTLSALLILLFSHAAQAQSDKSISIGKYGQVYSKIYKQNRNILVHVPESSKGIKGENYPVLFLLDGDNLFIKTVGMLDHLSSAYGGEKCPKMIVVGITHPNRMEDLLPVISKDNPANTDKFTEFLEKELIPYIDSNYPTQPYRLLVGHSLGGLRAAHTLLYHPQLFNAYIALDPSLGHDMNVWSNRSEEVLKNKSFDNKSMYVAMARTMPKNMDTAAIGKDTTGASRHMRAIMKFCKSINTNHVSGIDFNWKYYPDETHSGVTFSGLYDGLGAIFSWYQNKDYRTIFEPETSAASAGSIVTNQFASISAHMGYTVLPPEAYINELTDYLLSKNMNDKALVFAELNAKNYPTSESAAYYLSEVRWAAKKPLTELLTAKTTAEIADLCTSESKKENPEYNISENAINVLGYQLLQENKTGDALTIFLLNTDLYPNASNTWDSYGECLLLLGKEQEAFKAYKQSLKLNPGNRNAAAVLKKYKQE